MTNKCSKELLSLVGLHIVMKTAQVPAMAVGDIEQMNNAPDQTTGPVNDTIYNFFSRDCAGYKFNQPPSKEHPNFPTQVVRVTPIGNEAIGANNLYQAALRTLRPDNVWQYYVLVDAQWGASAKPLGVPNQPKWLANTTLKTYLQTASESKRMHQLPRHVRRQYRSRLPAHQRLSAQKRCAGARHGLARSGGTRRRYFHSAKPMPQPVPAAER